MKKTNRYAILVLFLAVAVSAGENLYNILPGKGVVTLEHDIALFLRYQGKNGILASQKAKAFEVRMDRAPHSMTGRGVWTLPQENTPAEVSIAAGFSPKDQSGEFRYTVKASRPVDSLRLELQIVLPVNRFAGQQFQWNGDGSFEFPEEFSAYALKTVPGVREFELPLSGGIMVFRLSRPCTVSIADNRKNNANSFFVNIGLIPERSTLTRAELTVRTEYRPFKAVPISLNEAANSTFTDQDPDDRKGGWTDQGANQDLRDFPTGKTLKTDFADFDILSAESNGGKECIVLGGGGRHYFPRRAEQNFPSPVRMKTLLLLHASAWTRSKEIGHVKLIFADGSEYEIPVVGNRDVGDWWNPTRKPNGFVAYHRRNDENDSGLYLSAFPVPEKPVRKMIFTSTGASVWMIAGAAASAERIKLSMPKNYLFTRDRFWREIKLDHNTVSGSPLDFSFMLDAPAGKYGRVIVRNGVFSFENAPQKRIRFYGTNLCTSACTLPKEQAEQLVRWLVGSGYNSVRLHQFDRELVDRSLPKNSLAFNETNIDNMDYLIHLLKKHGFYIHLDLFALRDRKPGEFKSAPGLTELKDMKLGIMVNPEIRENYKAFIRKFLGHKNKYTGLPLAQDPALAGICLINENMIISLYDDCRLFGKNGGESYRYCNRLFDDYCRKNNRTPTAENRRAMMNQFLYQLYREYFREMKALLRDELNATVALTDQNHRQPPLAAELRNEYDFVDIHIYWDHPSFIGKTKWVPPYQIRNKSLLSGGFWPIRALGPARILGKPFTVTEFNVCYPNQFRADSGLVFGAFAAYQDWDGLFRFDYAHKNAMFSAPYPGGFSTLNDPVRTLSDKIGALLFVRGDLEPAKEVLPLIVRPGQFRETYVESYPQEMQRLTMHVRTGSVLAGNALPENAMTPWTVGDKPSHSVEQAMTVRPPEIRYDSGKNTFAVSAKRSEAAALPQGETFTGKQMTATSTRGYSVIAAAAMDAEGKSLGESDRILLFFLTDIRQEGILFASEEGNVLLENPPHSNAILARNGTAEITLKLSPGNWSVVALDDSGKTLGTVPLIQKNGMIRLNADNFLFPGKVIFAYELKQNRKGGRTNGRL